MIRFEVESSGGHKDVVEVTGPGGSVFVGVGEPSHRSGVWRVQGNHSTPDVYIRGELCEPHYSLHASGEWHHAFKTLAMAQEVTGRRVRYLDEWNRGVSDGAGWTSAFTIWVPSEDVIDVPDDAQHGMSVAWLPQPPPGEVMAVRVIIAYPDRGSVDMTGVEVIHVAGAFSLSDGQVVLVIANSLTPGEGCQAQLRAFRAEVRRNISPNNVGPASGAGRSTLYGWESESGVRCLFDLAARPCARDGCPPQAE